MTIIIFSYDSAQENFLLSPNKEVRASQVNSEKTNQPCLAYSAQRGSLSYWDKLRSKRDLQKSCIATHPAHSEPLLAFPPFSASFTGIGIEVGEEVKDRNHPNIGNWKYLQKERKKKTSLNLMSVSLKSVRFTLGIRLHTLANLIQCAHLCFPSIIKNQIKLSLISYCYEWPTFLLNNVSQPFRRTQIHTNRIKSLEDVKLQKEWAKADPEEDAGKIAGKVLSGDLLRILFLSFGN